MLSANCRHDRSMIVEDNSLEYHVCVAIIVLPCKKYTLLYFFNILMHASIEICHKMQCKKAKYFFENRLNWEN